MGGNAEAIQAAQKHDMGIFIISAADKARVWMCYRHFLARIHRHE
jgi:hypothetical protein